MTYAYNGDGLLTAQTEPAGPTIQLVWDTTTSLPLLLTQGQTNYIYGPDELPVEQITGTTSPTVLYLHHDQQGSTRLLTSSTGVKEASFTYVQNSSKRRCQTPLGVTSAPCRSISLFISRIPVAFLGPVKAVINKVCTAVVHARGQILRPRRAFCTQVPGPALGWEYCGRVSTPFRLRLAEILDWRKYC